MKNLIFHPAAFAAASASAAINRRPAIIAIDGIIISQTAR